MVRERGFYWDDLRALIRRNQASNADIRYYRDEDLNPYSIAVFDRSLPRRNEKIRAFTGYGAEDHWRDSHVCEAAFFNGSIPAENNKGQFGPVDPNSSEFDPKLYRGALGVLERLLAEGCIVRSDELRHLFARHGRKLPAPTP